MHADEILEPLNRCVEVPKVLQKILIRTIIFCDLAQKVFEVKRTFICLMRYDGLLEIV